MSETHVAWIVQKTGSGAVTQARRVAEQIDARVTLVAGDSLDVEAATPGVHATNGVYHPTDDLDRLLRSFDPVPDVTVFHNYNAHIVESAPRIQTWCPTAVRVGMNFAEAASLPGAMAQDVPGIIEFVRQHDALIAPSEAAARDLRAVGVEDGRITVIPTLVDMSDPVEPELNAPYTVGHVAERCSPLKNQHLTVKVAAALRHLDPTYRAAVNITGRESQYRKTLQLTAAKLNVADLCRFVGYVDDMAEFWEGTGVNVLPSHSERHPSVVMEAARAGVPTVAAETEWAAEFDTVPTEPVDDPWSWAETVHPLLTNDARRARLAHDQQQEAIERFSADAVAPKYAALFEDLCDRVATFKADPEVVA